MELIRKPVHYTQEGKRIFDQFYLDEDYNVPEMKDDVRRVIQGTAVVATTHSDIILQHVNNMIKAYGYRNDEKFLGEAQIDQDDCLNIQDVAVYQFTNQGKTSVVEELKAGKDGFPVPTFSNALMDILDRTTMIQEYK